METLTKNKSKLKIQFKKNIEISKNLKSDKIWLSKVLNILLFWCPPHNIDMDEIITSQEDGYTYKSVGTWLPK